MTISGFVPNCKLVVPEPGIELIHVHADPLQRPLRNGENLTAANM